MIKTSLTTDSSHMNKDVFIYKKHIENIQLNKCYTKHDIIRTEVNEEHQKDN